MSTYQENEGYDRRFDDAQDTPGEDNTRSGGISDNSYAKTKQDDAVPVVKDDAPIEDPIDAGTADSDQALDQDDKQAIDESNIIQSRTRGAAKKSGTYAEPGDDEGLPGPEDGTSSNRQ